MAELDIRGFVLEVLALIRESMDVDAGRLGYAAVEHGLFEERPATETDCATEWAREWNILPGDLITVRTAALKAFLDGR